MLYSVCLSCAIEGIQCEILYIKDAVFFLGAVNKQTQKRRAELYRHLRNVLDCLRWENEKLVSQTQTQTAVLLRLQIVICISNQTAKLPKSPSKWHFHCISRGV